MLVGEGRVVFRDLFFLSGLVRRYRPGGAVASRGERLLGLRFETRCVADLRTFVLTLLTMETIDGNSVGE